MSETHQHVLSTDAKPGDLPAKNTGDSLVELAGVS